MRKVSFITRLQNYFNSPQKIISFILCIVLAVYIFVCGQGAFINNVINSNVTYGESSSEDEAIIAYNNNDKNNDSYDDRYEFKISVVDCCLFGVLVIVYICKKIHDKRKQKRRTK